MNESQYDAKFKDMQKYLPFIQRVIDRLKVNNEQMADNPRKAQLEKMEKLHDLLTNKVKNIKIETLDKCELVIQRLQRKLEMQPSFQNEDALLNKVQLKCPPVPSPATIKPTTQTEEPACPASPPPEVQDDSLEQPVVIPTERRCSPILVKEKAKQLQKLPQTQIVKDSQPTTTHTTKETSFSHVGRYDNNRINSAETNNQHTTSHRQHHQHHHNQHHHHNRYYYDNRSSSQGPSHSHSSNRSNTTLPKEKSVECTQKLQTVKVVITEPLPAHVKQQHFPSTSKYLSHTSVCHNNLKTLPEVSKESDNSEPYNPEDSWEQYNESRNNSLKQTHSASPVFKRLGAKVPETITPAKELSTSSKPSGRYTPISDVLSSSPLTVNDINKLLLESGVDKNDISAIGTRRPPKQELQLQNSPTNSFELSRKKLVDTLRVNSPVIESSPQQKDEQQESKTKSSTNLPHERIALKYNPHPRQERLQSLSSTDGSECSIQSKINDPRIKHKIITSPSTQSSPVNVNVLPGINFNDPRLKKQHIPSLRPPAQTSTPVIAYGQQHQQNSSNYAGRQDPRIARQQNNMPARRASINQPHYSSEENWDSDDQDKPRLWNKSDPRLDKRTEIRHESRYDNRFDNRGRSCTPKPDNRSRSCTPKPSNYANKSFTQTNASEVSYVRANSEDSNKFCPQLNDTETNKKSNKKYIKEPKRKFEPATTITVPNAPKSDSEEDWDTEPEDGNNKTKPKVVTGSGNLINPLPLPESLTSTNTFDNVTKPIPFESSPKPKHPALQNHKTLLNYVTPAVHTIGSPSTTTYKPPPLASHPAAGISPTTSYRPIPTATHLPPQHPIPITGHNHPFPLPHPAANNQFNAGSFYERNERFKYYETNTQTQRFEQQPRTYREFREAKERALAQEAALRRVAEASEAKKIAEALRDKEKEKEKEQLEEEAQQIKDKQTNRDELNKKQDERKANNDNNKEKVKDKDKPNNTPAESTLDKMYRTQNFSTQFPKASSSFKIPKKKTEEKPKEETKTPETFKPKAMESNNKSNKEDKETSNKLAKSKEEHKTTNETKEKPKENIWDNTKDKLNSRDPRCRAKPLQTNPIQDKEEEIENKQQHQEVKEKDKETTKQPEQNLVKETEKKKPEENVSENPESSETTSPNLTDIIITSSDKQVTLKPQQNLDMFNRLTQELSPKPQRILRRRNTMLVFDSAPLVDKEKLKKANAKLFEDVQDEERKRKKDEENRIARRNKHLEEMFKKTDDNCTVSTQNIIEGKRRTRPNMNFNEAANVSKVFKHKTLKDANATATQSPKATASVAAQTSAKSTKANFKIKLMKIDMKANEKQNDEETESEEMVTEKTDKQKQDECEESEEEEPTSEQENNTKTKKIGPKSKTKKPNKKLENKEEESNTDEQQEAKQIKKTKAKTVKGNKKQEQETELDSTDDEQNDKAKKITKAGITKTNKKLEESEEESSENEQNDKEETKKTKAKKLVKTNDSKGNKKPQDCEESEESEEENISKACIKTKTTKPNKKLEEEETKNDNEKNEENSKKESKATKAKARKTSKILKDTEEDTEKESETNLQNKTKKIVKTNANKTQEKSQQENQTETSENKEKETKEIPLTKTKPTETNAHNDSKENEEIGSDLPGSSTSNNEIDAKPNISDNEHQHCAVSSTSTDNTPEEFTQETPTTSCAENTSTMKKEFDDNEPTSTASKSLNATPTPDANVEVLNEIVEKIINNNDREHVLGLLGEILSEEKLKLIKSIIDNEELNKQQKEINEEPQQINENKQKTRESSRTAKQNDGNKEISEAEDEEEDEDDKPLKALKTTAEGRAKKQANTYKKKRSELDRLNEDIREMFISEGVLTATGRRMCTAISERAETSKKSPESMEQTNKRKSTNKRNLRRSLRGAKQQQNETEDEDNISLSTRNSEISLDDMERATSAESSPQRKMPILKPHTPIKIPEEVTTKATKTKETNKRKSDNKLIPKNKKCKLTKDDTESEQKDSETEDKEEEEGKAEERVEEEEKVEEEKVEEEETKTNSYLATIKNNNVHWHFQSKFLTWCMICEKRLSAKAVAVHYKYHHGENYISRLAPVILQQFKQNKHNRPLFGVHKGGQRKSWFFRCPFCLQYFNTPLMLWLEHFLNHTVEFRYECSKCHRSNNNKKTIKRHVKDCRGSRIITSAVKLTVPTEIKAHVCHLCNFLQLKRPNLERHYMEQHQIDKKTVELAGYTITLFDVANVECVNEENAYEREEQAWEFIKENEQVIDIPDDDDDDDDLEASTNVTNDDLDKSLENDNNTEQENIIEKQNNETTTKQNQDLSKDSNLKADDSLHHVDIPKAVICKANKSKDSTIQLQKKQATKTKTTLPKETAIDSESSTNSKSQTKKQTKISKADKLEELSANIIESQESLAVPKEIEKQKKHTQEVAIETQEPKETTKSKVSDTKLTVSSKDSKQSKDIEQIREVNSNDSARDIVLEETTTQQTKTLAECETSTEAIEKASKETKSLEKEQNSSKELLGNSNDKQVINETISQDVNTMLNNSSEETFTLVYESDNEDHVAVVSDCEVINEIDTQQHIQDELLSLAAQAANSEQEKPNEQNIQDELLTLAAQAAEKEQEIVVEKQTPATQELQAQTSMSDIISTSIDFIYKRGSSSKRKSLIEDSSEAKKLCSNQTNVFVTTHEESSNSPTTQILAQSIINIEDATFNDNTNITKPITMADRLSQRFKDFNNVNTGNKTPLLPEAAPKVNAFEKLMNDTLKELEMEKDSVSKPSLDEVIPSVSTANSCSSFSSAFSQAKANVFGNLNKPVKELEKEPENPKQIDINQTKLLEKALTMSKATEKPKEITKENKNTPTPTPEIITVISDDEDWEDIEITETAPTVPTTSTGNMAKSKNKGLFQKFGLFKGNNTKNKKHLTPLGFMSKKKNKDKIQLTNNINTSNNTTPLASPSNSKANNTNSINTTTTTSSSGPVTNCANVTATRSVTNSPFAHLRHNLGFKPVSNIMDDLLPDSPCNDPIDLVPELAPLEPLQDLNDISSILDSNLSAVNINVNNNHTSIEEALDFVNEQQEQQQQQIQVQVPVLPDSQNSNSNCSSSTLTTNKSFVNSIHHVGFTKQNSEENPFKFYCLLENCSFLFSSDAIGLETHFRMEHNQIRWNGYCYLCEAQCVTDCLEGLSITKEIEHMLDKHANNTVMEIVTNQDSNSCSTVVQEEKPKIKLRRLTGDCLSRSTPEITNTTQEPNVLETNVSETKTKTSTGSLMLGALLEAEPKPPTIDMPPQPEMPLTEPLLLDNHNKPVKTYTLKKPQTATTTETNKDGSSISWLRVGDVTVLLDNSPPLNVNLVKETSNPTNALQIASVVSLNPDSNPSTPTAETIPIPKISNVRSLTPKTGNIRSHQIEKEPMELQEAAAESWEVSRILANYSKPSTDSTRNEDDSPVIVAETVPIAQNKTGDFVITQTLSAQYNESSSTHLGFNINIAASSIAAPDNAKKYTPNTTATSSSSTSSNSTLTPTSARLTSRQYKCMAAGCKFVSRVPVAMSDHLRFHERRNFSNKRDYFSCGFCFHTATDVEDYMKHADQFHIISKTGAPPPGLANCSESDTATSLNKKILNILNSSAINGGSSSGISLTPTTSVNSLASNKQITTPTITPQVQDTEEVYLKKLRDTVEEIVGPTGLADDKLYRCVIKNCQTQLNEATFLAHIMFHINSIGQNHQHFTYKCPHCSAQYNRASGIKVHIKNHARNRYFCYLCEQTTANPGQLLKHFSEKHWHTMQMHTKILLKPKLSTDGSNQVLDSGYFVVYAQNLSDEELRKFGEKLILDWQRKKAGSKTHFKSSEIDLLPMTAIFTRDINCGECEYKTKVRTNMYRHLQMHKQNPGLTNKTGVAKVYSVDPVNPVPCLNSSERFFDKMTNLASSSLIPNSSATAASTNSKTNYKIPYAFVDITKRLTCHLKDCNYHTITEELFRTHMTTLHSNAMVYRCGFCQEDICKRGIATDRIIHHLRFHDACIFRCEECNYLHPLRYVVERHINEKHPKMKVNIVKHERTNEDNMEGVTTVWPFAGKKYRESAELDQAPSTSTRSSNSENSTPKVSSAPSTSTSSKGKGKWICDACGQKAASVTQIQTHCQQQHGVKNQYKCVHCTFGSQQLSQILTHIDDQHSGMAREARTMYHREENAKDKIADTRPLWQRNDPTRVRHIRGILMEDEEESLTITEEDVADDNEDNEELEIEVEVEDGDEDLTGANYLIGYEFGCFHCDYKAQTFEELKEQHYKLVHNNLEDKSKPFWYRLLRKFCCPECRAFVGIYQELAQHLKTQHSKIRFYGADVTTLENNDNTLRLLCGFCPVHCANAEDLLKHQLRLQHTAQDVRIDNNQQIMDILNLGQAEMAYQCTLCTDIFPNRVAIVDHACNTHNNEESFSFRELSNSLIYRCHVCCFTSTTELDLMRHMLDHYTRFKTCQFCKSLQTSFTAYMQHCYAQHKNVIHKFKTLYPLWEIRKFLLQMLIIFPSGLVLNKRNLLNTKYGKTEVIDELYEEMYKISQEPPIPRLSIARLVARKSIEAQHKHLDINNKQDVVLEAMQAKPKPITKRRRTLAVTLEENKSATVSNNPGLKPKINVIETKPHVRINKRRTTVDQRLQEEPEEFSAPTFQTAKISKRRRTVAVDRDTLFSSNLTSNSNTNTNSLLEKQYKKSKSCSETSDNEINYPLNLDMEPFSFYGQKPEPTDLTKIYTKIAIGGIKTPLTIDKFKLLFNIECQVKLTKCDEVNTNNDLRNYNQYKHIKKACPASHKIRYK